MKMAKATEEDMKAALLLLGILDDVESGKFPRRTGIENNYTDPHDFNEYDPDDLRAFYDRVMTCLKMRPSGISRVIWGFQTILDNNVLDPDQTSLQLHPRLNSDDLLKAAKEALAAIHDIKKAFGAPGDWGYGHPQGDSLVRLYTSTQALSKAIKEKEPKKEEQPKETPA